MKRLLLLTILIGLLFTSPNSFAQSSKPKRATIKYGNGVKYVGEIRKVSPKGFIIRKMKFKHGTGIMYFANGDQLNGEWCYDQCKRGTYKFAYGDIFEGEISESSIQNGKMIFSSGLGTMILPPREILRWDIRYGTTRLIAVLQEQSKIKNLIQALLIAH